MVWNAEGQFTDDHQPERVAWDIDSLPEALSAEQNSTRVLFEGLQ
jgi:hypothetical protein